MSTPSTLVADRYRLVKMLGAGGMGVVWQAWDERLRRPVALKLLRTQPELTEREREQATERAMREARITAGLHHPHAVTVFDIVEHEGQPCIVMQLIESTPLSGLLSEHGTLSPAETARIGAQVASALAAAHGMRIVHRDVKPGNILITADGSAMISDFGISHALGDTTITATGMIHGTPAYLAPEVAQGLTTSFASDVFSLGSTLYAMLEGDPPFGTEKNAIALLHKVARGGYPPPTRAGPLAPLLRSMLSSNPKRRPTMASVVESLDAVQERLRTEEPDELPWPFAGLETASAAAETEPFPVDAETPSRPAPAATEAIPDDAETQRLPDDAETQRLPDDAETQRLPDGAETEPFPAASDNAPPAEPATIRERTAATLPVAAPTAETVADVAARSAPPAVPTEPSRRGRRTAIVVGSILGLAAVVVVAVVLLWNPLGAGVDGAAERPASTSPAPAPATSAPDQTPAASPSIAPTTDAEPPAAPPEQRVAETLAGYYTLLPGDLDGAWPLMTADYQENHAGGRGGYEAFWADIQDVEIAELSVPAPDQAQATLTYYFRDGRVVQEVTAYQLVDEEGVLKIAASEVLTSTQL